jgi:hypothetical protein
MEVMGVQSWVDDIIGQRNHHNNNLAKKLQKQN